MGFQIEIDVSTMNDGYSTKPKQHYIALITGPGSRYALERSFVRRSYEGSNGDTKLVVPDRDGVYEVRDYPNGTEKRTRYYQVKEHVMTMLDTLNDEDVLDAVDAVAAKEWAASARVNEASGGPGAGVASTSDVLEAVDAAEEGLVEAFNDGLDEEDVRMHMDRIRRVVERL